MICTKDPGLSGILLENVIVTCPVAKNLGIFDMGKDVSGNPVYPLSTS